MSAGAGAVSANWTGTGRVAGGEDSSFAIGVFVAPGVGSGGMLEPAGVCFDGEMVNDLSNRGLVSSGKSRGTDWATALKGETSFDPDRL